MGKNELQTRISYEVHEKKTKSAIILGKKEENSYENPNL